LTINVATAGSETLAFCNWYMEMWP
jgi:hypothetical protein